MGQPQLLHEAIAICVDRLGREEELLSDLGGAEPLRGQRQDFCLAISQHLKRTSLPALFRLLVALKQKLRGVRAKENLVARDRADGFDHVPSRVTLVNVAAASRVEYRK